jgi:hypothetical protein
MPQKRHLHGFPFLPCLAISAITAFAQTAQVKVLKPSNAGIPDEETRFVRFAPEGKSWVGALSDGVAVLLIGNSPLPGDVNCGGVDDLGDLNLLVALLANLVE